jgi:NAD(P)-dependent dehydrogenase (short-subunit alcohol dehydrogenase family)
MCRRPLPSLCSSNPRWATTQMLPAGRWNQPEDLVGALLFLSSHLSDMVVGHVLMVDRDWTIH